MDEQTKLILIELRRRDLLPSSISTFNQKILDEILNQCKKYEFNYLTHILQECARSFKEAFFNSKLSNKKYALMIYGPRGSGKSTFLRVLLKDNVDITFDLECLKSIQDHWPSLFQPLKLDVGTYEFSDSLFLMRMAKIITNKETIKDIHHQPAGLYGLSITGLKFVYPGVLISLLLKFLYALENTLDIAISTSSLPFDHETLVKLFQINGYCLTYCNIFATPQACQWAVKKRTKLNYYKFSDLDAEGLFNQPKIPYESIRPSSFFLVSHSQERLVSSPSIKHFALEKESDLDDLKESIESNTSFEISKHSLFKSNLENEVACDLENTEQLIKEFGEENKKEIISDEDLSSIDSGSEKVRERICTNFSKCIIS